VGGARAVRAREERSGHRREEEELHDIHKSRRRHEDRRSSRRGRSRRTRHAAFVRRRQERADDGCHPQPAVAGARNTAAGGRPGIASSVRGLASFVRPPLPSRPASGGRRRSPSGLALLSFHRPALRGTAVGAVHGGSRPAEHGPLLVPTASPGGLAEAMDGGRIARS
ncbi:hypothetical protein THAOC_35858, partial [Thalassiosira oceanica]